MPIATDPFSKRTRNLLFDQIDDDSNGFMHRSEVINGFLKRIRFVKGILDLRPVWTSCFKHVRSAVDPVIPMGIDFMDRNQFRVYLICLWLYFRLWEYLYQACPKGNVTVKVHDLPEVVKILEEFGYPDAERFDAFVRPFFQDTYSEFPFSQFADVLLKNVLTELGEIDGEAERDNATKQIGKIHPGLLQKAHQVGRYKAHSMETGQPRMTGFSYKQFRKAASESALMPSPVPPQQRKGEMVGPQSWTSQYRMQYTTTKFHPSARSDPHNHPCHTERDVPFSHPFHQALKGPTSPISGQNRINSDLSRLVFSGFKPTEASRPLQNAGVTMAQKLQRMGAIQERP